MKTEDNDVKIIWEITEDLKEVSALYFWVDLLTCALLGYGLFVYALFHSGLISNICFVVAIFFLYRGPLLSSLAFTFGGCLGLFVFIKLAQLINKFSFK